MRKSWISLPVVSRKELTKSKHRTKYWTHERTQVLTSITQLLRSAPILSFPSYQNDFVVHDVARVCTKTPRSPYELAIDKMTDLIFAMGDRDIF